MFGLSRYLLIGMAAVTALGGFTAWRWLSVREALAVERAQHREAVAGFEEQLRQSQHQEQISREASRELQAKLSSKDSELAAIRIRSGGMQVYSYRFQPAPVPAPGGLAYASQEPERAEGTRVDLERLYALADRCQSDAAQLDTLIGWARAQAR